MRVPFCLSVIASLERLHGSALFPCSSIAKLISIDGLIFHLFCSLPSVATNLTELVIQGRRDGGVVFGPPRAVGFFPLSIS